MAKGLQRIYTEISSSYETANHLLTFGLDLIWRRVAASVAAKHGGSSWLDVCSGTGEMAIALRRRAGQVTRVVATDFSIPMTRVATGKFEAHQMDFTIADATALPFRDEAFNLITISFATRNLNLNRKNLVQCLREFHRILAPGGIFLNLETSQPPSRLIRELFHLYVQLVVKRFGFFLSGFRAGTSFLANSIIRFFGADEFTNILRK